MSNNISLLVWYIAIGRQNGLLHQFQKLCENLFVLNSATNKRVQYINWSIIILGRGEVK